MPALGERYASGRDGGMGAGVVRAAPRDSSSALSVWKPEGE